MNLHLGYPPGQPKPVGYANERNGASGKAVIIDRGPVRIEVPNDRDGSFEPILIPKHERRFTGFDERIIAMYTRGMSVREIRAFLSENCGTEVSPDFICAVSDEVMAEALTLRSRPLEAMYPVVFLDAVRVKSATTALSAGGPCIWPWAFRPTISVTCWACGSSRQRAPNSGSRC
jgi:putative transposase